MGTRSTIALEYADGSVKQIYCHWDGYVSHNGRILHDHYDTPEKAAELMDQGDCSSLDKTISECTFYARNRGESNVAAANFSSFDDYKRNAGWQGYDYIMRDGIWYLKDGRYSIVPLADVIKADAEN